jgi:hypothetical protein
MIYLDSSADKKMKDIDRDFIERLSRWHTGSHRDRVWIYVWEGLYT